jgi:hypothetical protein
MRGPAPAIAWEIWAAHRRGFTALLLAVPFFAVLYQANASAVQGSSSLRTASFVPMAVSLFLLFHFFRFAEASGGGSYAGFPARLFVLPVRTSLLLACPVLTGVAAILVLYAAWAYLVYLPLRIVLPMWPAGLLVVGLVCSQAIIWGLAGLKTLRLVVLGGMGTGLVSAALWLAPGVADGIQFPVRPVIVGALAASAFLGYVGAWAGVERQRRGGWNPQSPVRLLVQRAANLLRREERPFASAAAAQCWLEWRRSGVVLPACVGGILLLITGPITLLSGMDGEMTARTLAVILMMPFGLAAALGLGYGRPDFWSGSLTLTPFSATRPLTPEQMIGAKLRAAGLSALAAWLMILVVTPVWLFTVADPERVIEGWQQLPPTYPPLASAALAALGIAGAVTLTWALLVSGLPVSVFGRPPLFYAFAGSTAAAWLILLLLCIDPFSGKSFALEHSDQFLPATLRCIPWIVMGLLTLKIWTAVWALRRAFSQGNLSGGTICRGLLLWTMVAAGWAALVCGILPMTRLLSALFLFGLMSDWLLPLCCLAIPLALPLVRLAVASEALSRNRHR